MKPARFASAQHLKRCFVKLDGIPLLFLVFCTATSSKLHCTLCRFYCVSFFKTFKCTSFVSKRLALHQFHFVQFIHCATNLQKREKCGPAQEKEEVESEKIGRKWGHPNQMETITLLRRWKIER